MTTRPALECLDLIGEVMDLVKARMSAALKAEGLPLQLMEAHVLRIVLMRGGCTQLDVVRETRRDKAQVAKLVQTLVGRGLVLRVADSADARRQRLALTTEGEEVARICVAHRGAVAHQLLVGLSPRDRDDLVALLRTAANGLAAGPE